MRAWWLAGWIALGLCHSRPAFASDADAKARYEAGAQEYHAGHFAAAIDDFKSADAQKPSPALSFNIAQCYEKLADLPNARRYYAEYLTRKPGADDREAVQTTIASIDAQLTQASTPVLVAAPETPPVAAATVEQGPRRKHVVSWILLTAGGVGLLTGGGLNFASAAAANYPSTVVQTGAQVQADYTQATGLWTGALVGYGVGAALGVAGVVAYLVEARQ